MIKNTIDLNQGLNQRALWELLKYKIRFETKMYSKIKPKELKKFRSDLNIRITHLENKLSNPEDANDTHEINFDIQIAKLELERLEERESYGHYVRSKAFYIEHDQRNFFFKIEEQNYKEKHITKLINDKGCDITEPKIY